MSMMMNKEGAKPSLLCVLLQPTTPYINKVASRMMMMMNKEGTKPS